MFIELTNPWQTGDYLLRWKGAGSASLYYDVNTAATLVTSGTAGGAASLAGGVPGATGVGGAASVTGGIGGATSGAGGNASVLGGAGTNNANGGAVIIRGGAKNGTGTDGVILIGDSNTSTITFGKNPRIPVATVATGGNAIGNANVIAEGYTRVTGADGAGNTAILLPTPVAGAVYVVKNSVTNKVLVLFPAVGTQINGLGANNCYNIPAGAQRTFYAFNTLLVESDPETII